MDCKCPNDPDRFCYICGNVILPGRAAKVTDFVKKVYHAYFGVKLAEGTNHLHPMLAAKHVLRTCVIGEIEKGKVCHSLFLWCGERVKIM